MTGTPSRRRAVERGLSPANSGAPLPPLGRAWHRALGILTPKFPPPPARGVLSAGASGRRSACSSHGFCSVRPTLAHRPSALRRSICPHSSLAMRALQICASPALHSPSSLHAFPCSTCEVTAVDTCSPSMSYLSRLLTPHRLKIALASSVAAAAYVAQSSLSARIQAAEPAGDHIFVING